MSQSNQSITELNEKIRVARSLLIVLETDIYAERSDSIHLDVIKVVHNVLNEAQQILKDLQ